MCLVNHALGVVAELWWSLDYAQAVMVKGEKRWKEKCNVMWRKMKKTVQKVTKLVMI